MAYRTRRAFRAQYELLLAASVFEEAAARLEAPAGALGRPLRWRLVRDVERRRAVLATQLLEFRRETLSLLAPSDLLPDVGKLVLTYSARGADLGGSGSLPAEGPTLVERLAAAALGAPSAYVATAAWAATADELVTRGISNRPSLIIAELTALVLTPVAIFQGPERSERSEPDVIG